MKKNLLFLLWFLVFSSILLCFKVKSYEDAKPKVVVVLKDLNTEYWEIVKAGADKGFQDFGINGQVVAPRTGLKEDVQQGYLLEKILKEKPDVLVVSPFQSSAILGGLNNFVKNKIPVILVDTDIPFKNKTAFIGSNNFELGRTAGELLASQLQPEDEVALIAGDVTSPVIGDRINGAKLSLEAVGIKIEADKENLPNEPKPVRNAMLKILQQHPNIKGLFATTDIMALSALDVLNKQGYQIPVIGADGISKIDEEIVNDTLKSTVAQNPYDMGYLSVATALKVLKKERVEKNTYTGVDIITNDNAQQKLDFLNKLLR
ncbi:sugar ABC transporter substrate-binding protein [Neobacillus cucumis]|uniref:sugar ABC transporter substrate-binding protein n=1 Tax=Neobacillus cucumis TaxID=1740721 RepID=UPI002853255B|nr:substrate-binding domain-containing protein [Neobacillus cucumis]MDR4950325.1 substrate-binding domain-containing protein [Neobacillus cucumis]